jgi:phosphate transport system permease protein
MPNRDKKHTVDTAFGHIYAWTSMVCVASVCLLILLIVAWYGLRVVTPSFLITEPNASAITTDAGGILTPLVGTVLLTVIGIAVAYPFSVATAIYLNFYAKEGLLRTSVQAAIDILAGVPTIVIGLFALAVFSQPFLSFLSTPVDGSGTRAYGKSFLVSGIAMAVMILPFVIKSIDEAIKTVPPSYIEGSLALGASKWHTIAKVVLLSARQGITTGVILGMGRIIGDTAIVWLTLGGTLRMTGFQPWYSPENWGSTLRNTGSTLTTYIYFTSPAGEGNNYTVAFGAACVLIVVILVLNLIIAVLGSLRRVK